MRLKERPRECACTSFTLGSSDVNDVESIEIGILTWSVDENLVNDLLWYRAAKSMKPDLHIEEARGPFESRSFRHIIRSCLSRGTSVWPSLSSPAIKQLHSFLQAIKSGRVIKRKGLTSYLSSPCERKALVLILRIELLLMRKETLEDWCDSYM